jgi:hypothetical protein
VSRALASVLVLCSLACTRAEPTVVEPGVAPRPPPAVDVVLSGVTLGDEGCDQASIAAPAPASIASGRAADTSTRSVSPCTGPDCGDSSCHRTSIQLAIKAFGQNVPIKIKYVGLMDDGGKDLGELTVRKPLHWVDDAYVTWDEHTRGKDVTASYVLSSPNWSKLTNGKLNAAGRVFHLRVIVSVGGRERTLDARAKIPAIIEPPAVT